MTWKDILKNRQSKLNEFSKPAKGDEYYLRKLWGYWLEDADSYAESKFEMYSDGSLASYAKSYSKIIDQLNKLDIIKDEQKIESLLKKLEKHPMLPMETLEYPHIGMQDYEEGELKEIYESKEEEYEYY